MAHITECCQRGGPSFVKCWQQTKLSLVWMVEPTDTNPDIASQAQLWVGICNGYHPKYKSYIHIYKRFQFNCTIAIKKCNCMEICSTKHARRESRDNDIEGDIAVAVAAAAAAQLPPANCQLLLLGALILEEEQSRNCVSYSNNLQGSLQGLRHRMCGYRKRSLSDLIKGTDRPIWPSTDDLVLSATQKDMTRSLSEI